MLLASDKEKCCLFKNIYLTNHHRPCSEVIQHASSSPVKGKEACEREERSQAPTACIQWLVLPVVLIRLGLHPGMGRTR